MLPSFPCHCYGNCENQASLHLTGWRYCQAIYSNTPFPQDIDVLCNLRTASKNDNSPIMDVTCFRIPTLGKLPKGLSH